MGRETEGRQNHHRSSSPKPVIIYCWSWPSNEHQDSLGKEESAFSFFSDFQTFATTQQKLLATTLACLVAALDCLGTLGETGGLLLGVGLAGLLALLDLPEGSVALGLLGLGGEVSPLADVLNSDALDGFVHLAGLGPLLLLDGIDLGLLVDAAPLL